MVKRKKLDLDCQCHGGLLGIVNLSRRHPDFQDENDKSPYRSHRFPPEIISHGVWLYHRFSLSFREKEELLAKRGTIVTYETVQQWCMKFGLVYARHLRRRQGRKGDIWLLDEVFAKIRRELHYQRRAVDQGMEYGHGHLSNTDHPAPTSAHTY